MPALTVPFVGGVAKFTADAGPFVDAVGKYTLTVTEVEPSTGVFVPTNTTTPVTTRQFSVGGFQLAFLKSPATSDINVPLTFKVGQQDSKHKLNKKLNSHHVRLVLTPVEGGAAAKLSDFTGNGFLAGAQNFAGSAAPSVDLPGTYTLTAFEVDEAGADVATTLPATSRPFKVQGLHFAFLAQPRDTSAYQVVPFKVAVLDAKNKVVAAINEGFAAPELSAGGDLSSGLQRPFGGGVVESSAAFTDFDAAPSVVVRTPGTFQMTLRPLSVKTADGRLLDDVIEPVTSKPFRVTGYHLAFRPQPKSTGVYRPVGFKVAVLDAKNKVQTNINAGIMLPELSSGGETAFLDSDPFSAGVVESSSTSADHALGLRTLGSFTLTVRPGSVRTPFSDAIIDDLIERPRPRASGSSPSGCGSSPSRGRRPSAGRSAPSPCNSSTTTATRSTTSTPTRSPSPSACNPAAATDRRSSKASALQPASHSSSPSRSTATAELS